MKNYCRNCNKEFTGRSDKRFCSAVCKNKHNNNTRNNTREAVKEIDAYLHRNREILLLLLGSSKKEVFDKSQLVRSGFKFDYMTGIYFNRENKMYRIVYDCAWMDFSDQKILVVKKKGT
jgi:hypothetical protein